MDKFYEGQEEEDEDGNESVVAADFESDEKESEEEVIEDANLLDKIDNGHAKTTFRIDDEWLKNLQCAFDLRREELSKMNLPFWKIETERLENHRRKILRKLNFIPLQRPRSGVAEGKHFQNSFDVIANEEFKAPHAAPSQQSFSHREPAADAEYF